MKKVKQILILFLLSGLFSQAWALKISELLVHGTVRNFQELGFKNASSLRAKLDVVFKDVFPQGNVSAEQLEKLVSNLAKEDNFFKELDNALKLDAKSVKFEDIEQAYVQSIMLTHVRGKNLVCTDACQIESATKVGKVSILNFVDKNLTKLKDKLGKMKPSSVRNLIANSFGGEVPANLGPLEKKQIAFFLLMQKSRSKVQRRFFEVTKKLSLIKNKNGKREFNSNFYKIPSSMDNLTDDQLSFYTGLMEIAGSKQAQDSSLQIEDAFYRSIDDLINRDDVAADSKVALREIKVKMQNKNCLFN